MYREDGKLAARGRHVKHLPMGRAWDLTATPSLFPYARKWTMRQHEQWLKDPERTKVKLQCTVYSAVACNLVGLLVATRRARTERQEVLLRARSMARSPAGRGLLYVESLFCTVSFCFESIASKKNQ